jgi:hypothetical protein
MTQEYLQVRERERGGGERERERSLLTINKGENYRE